MNLFQQKTACDAMVNWLKKTGSTGKAPPKIICCGQFDLHGMLFYVYKFKVSFLGKWLVGVSGGFENSTADSCDYVYSKMEPYCKETAIADCRALVEWLREQKKQQFEKELLCIQEKIIKICLTAVGESVDTICAYCYTLNGSYSFNMFTLKEQRVRKLEQLNISYSEISKAFDDGIAQLILLQKLCQTYKVICPVEMKIVYDLNGSPFTVDYTYPPVKNKELFEKGFDLWLDSYYHPAWTASTKQIKKGILLKKQWTVKQSGLRNPLMSETATINDNTLVYFLEYDKSDQNGYYESQLRYLDLKNLKERTVFSERHVIRDIGISENHRRYFTSFSGKLYCIDENEGNILWEVRVGKGNASWEIIADENNVYMFNGHMYAIDKQSGQIVWESPENLSHSKCTMAINEKYIYRCNSGGTVFCMDKSNGKIIWKFGERTYDGNCILLSDTILFVTVSVNGFGKMYMLNAYNGAMISETVMEKCCTRRPQVVGNMIYLGNELGEVKCYEISAEYKLTERYSFLSDSSVTTTITMENNLLWFGTKKGYLYCLDKQTGEEMTKRKRIGTEPRWISAYEGGLLVLSDKGQIEYFSK